MITVRVTGPRLDATFDTDGVIRRTDPGLRFMLDWPEERAGDYIVKRGWACEQVESPIDAVTNHPLVAAVLALFPGSCVSRVYPLTDDGFANCKQNANQQTATLRP